MKNIRTNFVTRESVVNIQTWSTDHKLEGQMRHFSVDE